MIGLNIHTNCIATAPDTRIVMATWASFVRQWGREDIEDAWVFVDRHPYEHHLDSYVRNLSNFFPRVSVVDSLVEGWLRGLHERDTEFIFMLEHDWLFGPGIWHSLPRITAAMNEAGLDHMRFNKWPNKRNAYDTEITEERAAGVPYCRTPCWSNNPNLTRREAALAALTHIDTEAPGTAGIEEKLTVAKVPGAAMYGPAGYPATVFHTDGKKLERL